MDFLSGRGKDFFTIHVIILQFLSYSFKRGTKSEKGWSCRGRPLKTEFGAIMGMKLATTARRKKREGTSAHSSVPILNDFL